MEYICKICSEKFENNNNLTEYAKCGSITQAFKKHLKNVHNISFEEYIINNYFNGKYPECNCGCGAKLKFNPKNALWDKNHGFGKYVNCGHVARNNKQIKNTHKENYLSKWENIEWIKNHYYEEYGKDNIENSAKDFLENNELTNIDIGKKYGIDIRTLKNIWYKLKLVSKEQWEERCLYRKHQVSGKRRKRKFENKDIICAELFNIIKNNPFKYNIRSLVDYYNSNNLVQIETDIHIVLNELEQIYGEEIYDYLEYNKHSKEEKNFLYILKFFMKKPHNYKCGFPLQYGINKSYSYIYDICIDNEFIIEYDGIFYHNENNKERDLKKENFAIDNGYKFIRISSLDFKNIDMYKQIINLIEHD